MQVLPLQQSKAQRYYIYTDAKQGNMASLLGNNSTREGHLAKMFSCVTDDLMRLLDSGYCGTGVLFEVRAHWF